MAEAERAARGGVRSLLIVGAVLVALELLWMRFNARPGVLSPDTEAWRMAAQGDLLAYYLPMMELVAGRLASGELPLWNPHACSGIPLLATLQSGVFYPGNWLALGVPAHHAISWLMFVECALAGLFAASLFRAWGHGEVASALGGVLYLFACVFGQMLWPPVVSTLVWVPWLLLAVHHLAGGLRTRWWCGLALGVAVQVLAGFPQYVVYGFFLLAPITVFRLAEVGRAGASGAQLLARGAAIASAIALGFGLASVQLLPSLELMQQSLRQAALTATEIHYLAPWDPYSSGDVLRASLDPSPSFVGFNLGTSGGYLGLTTLLLAMLAVVAAPRRARTWLWVALGVLALVLSDGLLGWSAPLYRVYAELPIVGAFRTPERLRVVTFFCVIALAVAGLDAVRANGASRRARLRIGAVVIAVGLASGMIALGHAIEAWRVAASLALVLVLLWDGASASQARTAELGVLGLVVIDLVLATGEYGYLRQVPLDLSNRFMSNDRRTVLPVGFFEEQRDAVGLARIELVKYRPRIATAPSHGGYRVSCYEPLVPAQWTRLERELHGKPPIGATLFDLDPTEHALFYDIAGVKRILTEPTEGDHHVEENHDALPRAYLVNAFRVVGQARAFRHLRAGDVDFHAEVLLDRDPGLRGVGFPWPELIPAEITAYEAERVVVEAESPGPALLVLSDTDYPGWEATVDGAPVEIFRANGLYRAVRLNGGRHRVVFEYAPASLRSGAALSFASLLVLIVVAARGVSRSTRS